MHITQVRNATMLIQAAGKRILVDPMLGAKGSFGAAPTTADNKQRNPLVDLPMPLSELLDVDVVIITHTHPDHWDEAAAALLPRQLPVIVQNSDDAESLQENGFSDVRVLDSTVTLEGVTFTRTEGQHGSDEFLAANPGMGTVMGFVLTSADEPSVYIAGDTVWGSSVRTALAEHTPDIVVLNTGEARWAEGDAIIMGAEDVLRVHRELPSATIIAVHMEALNHCVVSRDQVRTISEENGIAGQVLVPADGEHMTL